MTVALSLPMEHRPQTIPLHLALSCTAASIFLQLYLKPVVHISFSSSFLQVFFGCPLPLWPSGAHQKNCFAMLSSLFHRVFPNQFRFIVSWDSTDC